jgi:hypothetical protein
MVYCLQAQEKEESLAGTADALKAPTSNVLFAELLQTLRQ